MYARCHTGRAGPVRFALEVFAAMLVMDCMGEAGRPIGSQSLMLKMAISVPPRQGTAGWN
jgi:hypothetical protein